MLSRTQVARPVGKTVAARSFKAVRPVHLARIPVLRAAATEVEAKEDVGKEACVCERFLEDRLPVAGCPDTAAQCLEMVPWLQQRMCTMALMSIRAPSR